MRRSGTSLGGARAVSPFPAGDSSGMPVSVARRHRTCQTFSKTVSIRYSRVIMARRPTIHDVAQAAGVSVATVSKAVNGRYGIADATVARVLAEVERLGYESSLVASSMRARQTGVIGVLVADFEPFSAEILKGVGAGAARLVARPAGLQRLARQGGGGVGAAIAATSVGHAHRCGDPGHPDCRRGGIRHPHRRDRPAHRACRCPDGRIRQLRRRPRGDALPHRTRASSRRIPRRATRPALGRPARSGLPQALADAGLVFDPSLIEIGRYEADAARAAARTLLSAANPPTAVFAANDLSASPSSRSRPSSAVVCPTTCPSSDSTTSPSHRSVLSRSRRSGSRCSGSAASPSRCSPPS